MGEKVAPHSGENELGHPDTHGELQDVDADNEQRPGVQLKAGIVPYGDENDNMPVYPHFSEGQIRSWMEGRR